MISDKKEPSGETIAYQSPQFIKESIKQGNTLEKPLCYWDYINLDTLLSLQNPKTDYPDEMVFVMYHQVTELYFKLILHELKQLVVVSKIDIETFSEHVGRITRYFGILVSSFDVMTEGMQVEQYLAFRTALSPASGFQSVQYRLIEIFCTPLDNLISQRVINTDMGDYSLEEKLQKVYWQDALQDYQKGKKSPTLSLFEGKYMGDLIETATKVSGITLFEKFQNIKGSESELNRLTQIMRELDLYANVKWPLVHYNVASKYLDPPEGTIEATGGSKWKKYLHPMYQKRIFFPDLWSTEEKSNWAKE